MLSTSQTFLALGTTLFALGGMAGADQLQMDGKVTHVTLYRSQALITRTLDVEGAAGPREIVISNLPEHVVSDSLFAEGSDNLEVRAVQFRTRAVGASPREEVRKLQEEIQVVQQQMELNSRNAEVLSKQLQYLDKLEAFVAPTATTELSQGVLDAEALERLTKFSFDQRKEIVQQQVDLASESRKLQEQLSLLERKLAEITTGASKAVREAVLYVQKLDAEPQAIRLNYLVNSCGWSPTYSARSSDDRTQVKLEYNGLIYQMSGEDWQDVVLTLSTASPVLSAAGPGLAPFRVSLQPSASQGQLAEAQSLGDPSQLKQLWSKQQELIYANRNAISFDSITETSWGINDAANQFACMELIGDSAMVNNLKVQLAELSQEPSLSYQLASAVSLPSRSSQQMVRILQTQLPSHFYHVATPVLTTYVYREAEVTNDSTEDLLAGPITVYLGDRFVGRGEIPTVARGQTFVVGFGADPQLRARRELADKTDGINGGNRELKFQYRLVIENYKDAVAQIRVIDRLPAAENGDDIRVTLQPLEVALSDDKVYRRLERPEGILRWDIDVAARAMGDDAQFIDYGFVVEYDRNYQVSVPSATAQMQQEFEQLQKSRSKR